MYGHDLWGIETVWGVAVVLVVPGEKTVRWGL